MNTNQLIFGTGASSSKDYEGLLGVVRTAVQSGIFAFDTAPSYATEATLGGVLRQVARELGVPREKLFIQTKIDAWQMQKANGNVEPFVDDVLSKMGLKYLDSLLIHWPLPEYLESTWQAFVRLYDKGRVRKIGICNVRMRQLRRLVKYDFPPQIIQIERNPLRVCAEEIEFCGEHGIEVQSYSPLCKMDARIKDNVILKNLSLKYQKNIGQTVMRWHIDTGVTPIFTSTKPERVREYAAINDFKLTEKEIADISSLNVNYKMYLESWSCPGF